MDNNKIIKYSTASLYIILYVIVATISCICSIDFFDMTHTYTSSIILAISFEIGSMGCLFGAITTLKNKNNSLIWIMFIFLTLMQMMNNTYYAYSHIENFNGWVELFDLVDFEVITQKRIISIISGCVLPLVSLSFIHLLVDLLKSDEKKSVDIIEESDEEEDEIDDEKKETIEENAVVYDAVPATDKQVEEFEKNTRSSTIKSATDEMKKALNSLQSYNKRMNNGK